MNQAKRTVRTDNFDSLTCIGMLYTPDFRHPVIPALSIALDDRNPLLQPAGAKRRPCVEILFNGFTMLGSTKELIGQLQRLTGNKRQFALTGVGVAIVTPMQFSGDWTIPLTGETAELPSKQVCAELSGMVALRLKTMFELQCSMVIEVFPQDVIFSAGELMVHFVLGIPVSVEVWQELFALKSAEMTAAAAYHAEMVGQVGETAPLKQEDIAIDRTLN